MKYLFEIILEDDLYDLKRQNRIKESLIQLANDEIQNLQKENQYKISTIQYCNEEIVKEIQINHGLMNEKKKLTLELEELRHKLKIEEDKTLQLEAVKNNLENRLSISEASLESEHKQKLDLEIINKKLQDTFSTLSLQIEKLDGLNKELNNTLKRRDSELLLMSAELKVQRDHVDDIQNKMKNLKDLVNETEMKYFTEKQLKMKAEKQRDTMGRSLNDLKIDLEQAKKSESIANDLRKQCESEMSKLRIDYDEAKMQHDITYSSLKIRHEDTVAEMTRQIEQLFKAKSKFVLFNQFL